MCTNMVLCLSSPFFNSQNGMVWSHMQMSLLLVIRPLKIQIITVEHGGEAELSHVPEAMLTQGPRGCFWKLPLIWERICEKGESVFLKCNFGAPLLVGCLSKCCICLWYNFPLIVLLQCVNIPGILWSKGNVVFLLLLLFLKKSRIFGKHLAQI